VKKYLLTLNAYPEGHEMNRIFKSIVKPNFDKYCQLNNFELIVINHNVAYPLHIHWSKIIWIQENWKRFRKGDIITYIDSDSLIMDMTKDLAFEKTFAIPIESTGLYCMGFFSVHVCDWVKNLFEIMLSFEPACNKSFNDNHAFYLALGKHFGQNDIENENIQLLPVNYNVTIIPDELTDKDSHVQDILKQYYKPELAIPKEEIIIRHFAAGQIYYDFVNNYLKT
jgi:hypothetical protein